MTTLPAAVGRPRPTPAELLIAAVVLAALFAGFRRLSTPTDFLQFWFVAEVDPRADDGRGDGPALSPYPPDHRDAYDGAAARRFDRPASGPKHATARRLTRELFPLLGDGRLVQSTGTPLLYATADLVSGPSFERSYAAAYAVQSAAFIGCLLLMAVRLRLSAGVVVCWGFGVGALFEMFAGDIRYGNVAGVQLALLLASLEASARRRLLTAGGLAAFAALLKPSAAYGVLSLTAFLAGRITAREWARFAAGGLVGGAVATVLTVQTFGSLAVWSDWVTHVLPGLGSVCYPRSDGNIGLVAILHHATGTNLSRPIGAVLLPAALAACYALGLRRRGTEDDSPGFDGLLAAHTLGTCVMLLSSPLVWTHYFVLLLPSLITLMHRSGRRGRAVAAVSLCCFTDVLVFGPLRAGAISHEAASLIFLVPPIAVFADTTARLLHDCGLSMRRLTARRSMQATG